MSKLTFKNKKPLQLDVSEEVNDVEPLDTFEQFCSNLQNPYSQNKLIEGSFLQDSFEQENTVRKQDLCIQLSVSCSDNDEDDQFSCKSLRLSSPQHEQNFSIHTDISIKFIQFEEFLQGKSFTKTFSQSDSIKSQEQSRQQIRDISQSNSGYLKEPPAPANRNAIVRFKFPNKPYQFKKDLQIVIPEMEESSYEQTLVKESINPNDSSPEDLRSQLHQLQKELVCVRAQNIQESDSLYNHVLQMTSENESLKSENINMKSIIEVKDLKIEALLKINQQLFTEKQTARDKQTIKEDRYRITQNEKPEIPQFQLQTPTDEKEKIQYLIGKLHKKSEENSSLQYQISILKNKIEEIQNYYFLENRRELSIQPFETDYSSPPTKEVPIASLGYQKVIPDQLKQNLSFSSISRDDLLKIKQKKEVCSSEQLLNKIKIKHQTEGLNQCSSQIQTYIKSIKLMDQPDQKAKLLFFRKKKQEKVFSIQTSPQIQKLQTEKPLQQSVISKSNTNSQPMQYIDLYESNFFHQLPALSRKTSDALKQEDLTKISTPNLLISQFSNQMIQKQNLNSVRDLLEPSRKLSQVSRKALQSKQERSIQQPVSTLFSRSSCDYMSENVSNNHQRNISSQETKPHFMTIFEF